MAYQCPPARGITSAQGWDYQMRYDEVLQFRASPGETVRILVFGRPTWHRPTRPLNAPSDGDSNG